MRGVTKIVDRMRRAPQNVTFADLRKVCVAYFGEPRQEGTSHLVFKMPWAGDPRVNIQRSKGGKAKPYQVAQVIRAIDRMEGENK